MQNFSEESLELRRELAYACRILATNGQNDTIYGHITYRKAGAKTFWMKPAAMGLDEITPETLIRVDLDGNVVEGELPRHVEFPIHSQGSEEGVEARSASTPSSDPWRGAQRGAYRRKAIRLLRNTESPDIQARQATTSLL